MKGVVLVALGLAFIAGGVFLIRRGRAMSTTVERQLNSWPDTWQAFSDRSNMFGFGIAMFVLAGLSFCRAFVSWFSS